MDAKSIEKIAIKISVITVIANLFLAAIKLAAGIIADSYALISDAVNSASDVFTTLIVIVGIKIAAKREDEKHQFGHDRFECVAAILLSFMLALTGGSVGVSGVKSLIDGSYDILAMPNAEFALAAAVISIIAKEILYWYTRAGAKKTNSGALMAQAWDHRADVLSSIGSLAAVLGAKFGLPILDPIAGIIICLFILRAAVTIFVDAIRKMTDEAMDEETISRIRKTVLIQEGALGIDSLKTRKFGGGGYVEVEIEVDCNLTVCAAHEIAEKVHDAIEADLPSVKHCVVHINPSPQINTQQIEG